VRGYDARQGGWRGYRSASWPILLLPPHHTLPPGCSGGRGVVRWGCGGATLKRAGRVRFRKAANCKREEMRWLPGIGRVVYFPAYELLVDDLRDYRFYAEDMLHPSPLVRVPPCGGPHAATAMPCRWKLRRRTRWCRHHQPRTGQPESRRRPVQGPAATQHQFNSSSAFIQFVFRVYSRRPTQQAFLCFARRGQAAWPVLSLRSCGFGRGCVEATFCGGV
jgi:hypothetical protein